MTEPVPWLGHLIKRRILHTLGIGDQMWRIVAIAAKIKGCGNSATTSNGKQYPCFFDLWH
jgi:hypothetical protein